MEQYFLEAAYKEAMKAYKKNEVPVGAVIVYKNKIIARGYNRKEKNNVAIDHAEIIVIRKTCKKLKSWRLTECDLYVTLEPCSMCMGAIREARIRNVYYATSRDKKEENVVKVHKIDNTNKYSKILSDFFKQKRK